MFLKCIVPPKRNTIFTNPKKSKMLQLCTTTKNACYNHFHTYIPLLLPLTAPDVCLALLALLPTSIELKIVSGSMPNKSNFSQSSSLSPYYFNSTTIWLLLLQHFWKLPFSKICICAYIYQKKIVLVLYFFLSLSFSFPFRTQFKSQWG